MVMDHGRVGPNGAVGGAPGGVNKVVVNHHGRTYHPPHLSKDQDIPLVAGESVRVSTPGGGGYGDAFKRDPDAVAADVARGYYTVEQAAERFGVILAGTPPKVDTEATTARRSGRAAE